MKTKLTLAVFCCLSAFVTFGQTVPFPTDTVIDTSVPFSEKMDDEFGNLDLTNVTTNLLLDRAWPFAKPAVCDEKAHLKTGTLNIILMNANRKLINFSSNS